MACEHAAQLEAIKQTKVNMTAWLAVYNVPDNATAYEEQRDKVVDALKTYGPDHVGGVTVGNEFILKCVPGPFASGCGFVFGSEVLTSRASVATSAPTAAAPMRTTRLVTRARRSLT